MHSKASQLHWISRKYLRQLLKILLSFARFKVINSLIFILSRKCLPGVNNLKIIFVGNSSEFDCGNNGDGTLASPYNNLLQALYNGELYLKSAHLNS